MDEETGTTDVEKIESSFPTTEMYKIAASETTTKTDAIDDLNEYILSL